MKLALSRAPARRHARAHGCALSTHAAAAESRATYGLTHVPEGAEAMAAWIDVALAGAARGDTVPFATFDRRSGRVVGSTRFANVERWTWPGAPASPGPVGPGVEIGWTWLAASAQRSHVNTGAKLLMLSHAFDVCACGA